MWVLDISATPESPRQRIFRATRREVEQEASNRFGEQDKFGADLTSFTHRERAFLRYWLDRMPIEELERIVADATKDRPKPVKVSEAISAYLDAPRERKISDRHASDLKSRLKMFKTAFGQRLLADLSPGEIEGYILGKGSSAPNHYRILRGLFGFTVRHRWLPFSPIGIVKKPVIVEQEKELFTPEQMTKALRIAAGVEGGVFFDSGKNSIKRRDDPLLRILIAGGLCGMRDSEIMRLDCADVNAAIGEIHVRKMKTQVKGIRERYAIVPDNARAWLQWLDLPKAGRFIECNVRNMSSRRGPLATTLKFKKWPNNVLRRSFGSYHLAAFQNASLTAEIMGHEDAATTKAKYRVARRKEEADAWFAITPDVLTAEAE